MPKIISFSNVVEHAYKECVNLYGCITNYGNKFISNYKYIYIYAYKLLSKEKFKMLVVDILKDNIEVGKEYYFLSSSEKIEEQVALILAFKLKKRVQELKRTIKFLSDLYRKNKGSFFDEKFILLLNRQCGRLSINYEVFEMFLIVFEYFHYNKELPYDTAINISFKKLEIVCPGTLLKIFECKNLNYENFINLINSKVKSNKQYVFSDIDFLQLPKVYKKSKI